MAARKAPKARRRVQTQMAAKPHPSRCGNAYRGDYRALIQEQSNAGVLAITANVCCRKTLYNHNRRLQATGSLLPYKPFGGVTSDVLQGRDRFLCVYFMWTYPMCTISELKAFIYNYSLNPRLFSSSQITECEDDLGVSRIGEVLMLHKQIYLRTW